MELRHLRYVVALAEELHFGRAAARLQMAQPPLSQQIRQLEQELGMRLFNRTQRSVSVTEAGAIFVEGARRTLEEADRTIHRARLAYHGQIGTLRVGVLGTATLSVLPDIIRAYRTRYPNVELVLDELHTATSVTALQARTIDVGFARSPVHADGLIGEVVHNEGMVVALPEGHRLCGQQIVRLQQLAEEPFILWPRGESPVMYDEVIACCQRAGFSPRVVQQASRMETMTGLVAAGMGVTLVMESVRHLQRPGVVYRPLADPGPRFPLLVIWRQDNASAVLSHFLRVVREHANQERRP